jgi:outer membrane protein assembly factor BamD
MLSPSSLRSLVCLVCLVCIVLPAATLGTAGCDNEQPKTALGYTADAKHAYDAALEEFKSHNWIESQNLMREVKRKYSYSKYARLAELRIADADYEQEKYADAIREYRQFVHDHRSDTEVSYARSRIAESQYKEIDNSILLPAGEERDQATVLDAYKELRKFATDYPGSKESKHMHELLVDVTARLVKHELYVARFYLRKDNYEACIARIQYALRNFSGGFQRGGEAEEGSGLAPDALLLMGETYLKMHKWVEARESFTMIVKHYPDSGLIVQANRYLDFLKTRT